MRAGAPAEVPVARDIVVPLDSLSQRLRALGIPVFWVLRANTRLDDKSDWDTFFDPVVADEARTRTVESLLPGRPRIWQELQTSPQDTTVIKNRYSALIPGSSALEPMLRRASVSTLLITSTKINVCCESTARAAMMLDFKVVMVSDCCAALSDEEHKAALETIIQQSGDLMTASELIERLLCQRAAQATCRSQDRQCCPSVRCPGLP